MRQLLNDELFFKSKTRKFGKLYSISCSWQALFSRGEKTDQIVQYGALYPLQSTYLYKIKEIAIIKNIGQVVTSPSFSKHLL